MLEGFFFLGLHITNATVSDIYEPSVTEFSILLRGNQKQQKNYSRYTRQTWHCKFFSYLWDTHFHESFVLRIFLYVEMTRFVSRLASFWPGSIVDLTWWKEQKVEKPQASWERGDGWEIWKGWRGSCLTFPHIPYILWNPQNLPALSLFNFLQILLISNIFSLSPFLLLLYFQINIMRKRQFHYIKMAKGMNKKKTRQDYEMTIRHCRHITSV